MAQAPTQHAEAREFVREAVAVEFAHMEFSKQTRDLLLKTDEKGHPLYFIPACLICLGVEDALEQLELAGSDRDVPVEWAAKKASTRTSSLAKFVKKAVKNKLDSIQDMDQRMSMVDKLRAGSDEGQRQLARYQSRRVKAYKRMWSCLMCDAASRAGEK